MVLTLGHTLNREAHMDATQRLKEVEEYLRDGLAKVAEAEDVEPMDKHTARELLVVKNILMGALLVVLNGKDWDK